MAIDSKIKKLGETDSVFISQVRFQKSGDMWKMIVKGRFGMAEAKIKFVDLKDLAHAGDALQYVLTPDGWKDDKPFDVQAWQARNRKSL